MQATETTPGEFSSTIEAKCGCYFSTAWLLTLLVVQVVHYSYAEKRCHHHYTFIANKQMCAVAGMPCVCNVSCNSGNAGSFYSSVRVRFVYGEE